MILALLGNASRPASFCWNWTFTGGTSRRHVVCCKIPGTLSKPTVYMCSQLCRQAHEACGPMEIDSALSTVQTLKNELQDAKMAATESQLKPLPGETVRWAGVCLLCSSCEAVFIWLLVCSNIRHFECKASGQPHGFRTALWQGLTEGPAAGAVSAL